MTGAAHTLLALLLVAVGVLAAAFTVRGTRSRPDRRDERNDRA